MRSVLPCSLSALVVLASASPARAQMEDPPTYQDTTGLTWAVGTLELGLILSAVAVAAGDDQSAQAIGALALGAAVVASGVAAGVAQGLDAPVEPAMVFHHGIVGAALVGGLLSFSLRASGMRDQTPTYVGLVGLLVGAAGAVTYSVLRMDRLAHDPQLVEEAHVLSWAPILSAGLLTAVLTAVGLTDAAGVLGATVGLVALGVAIALVEVAIAEHPAPEEPVTMEAPLVGWSARF